MLPNELLSRADPPDEDGDDASITKPNVHAVMEIMGWSDDARHTVATMSGQHRRSARDGSPACPRSVMLWWAARLDGVIAGPRPRPYRRTVIVTVTPLPSERPCGLRTASLSGSR